MLVSGERHDIGIDAAGLAPTPPARPWHVRLGQAGAGLSPVLPEMVLYALVSAVALLADIAVFLALVTGKLGPTVAGITGYALGMLVHFVLSCRLVFPHAAALRPSGRLLGEFVATGLAGLVVTALVIWAMTTIFSAPPIVAKAAAVAVSFLLVYALRRTMVFRAPG